MRLRKRIENLTFETDFTHKDNIFDLPRTKKERIDNLKIFIFRECNPKWKTEPKDFVTLKKRYITELLESLS